MTKKTNELFIKEIKNKVGNEYVFLEEYINSKEKIHCLHTTCGNRWKVSPNNFLNKSSRCPKCNYRKMAKRRTKTSEEFVEEVSRISKGDYTPLDKYTHGLQEIKMRHNVCGTVWAVRPITFTSQGQRCPRCTSEKIAKKFRKGTLKYRSEVEELTGGEYEVLGKYGNNNKVKIKHKHVVCGHIYYARPHDFLAGNRCPLCFGTPLKSRESFIGDVFKIHGGEYTAEGEYINNMTKIEVIHNNCGLKYKVTPNSILSGSGCPNCNKNKSKGEEMVSKILKDMGVSYTEQYSIENLKNKNNLRFDFAVFFENKKKLLIEYDGVQHFKPIEYFGGDKGLEYQRMNDNIKNKYCAENNIELLRIPYWKFNEIEEIVRENIKNFKD